ncbi:MAG: glycosyltransferase [Chloroflexi bacterium]|nr:glycosyltransferase [Chloroflexota bacterium]
MNADPRRRRIVVVGSGTRFLSGISIYAVRLANAFLTRGHDVSIVTMRALLPARFYPGRARVGSDLTELGVEPGVARFDGIDWFWFPSMLRGIFFLLRRRPEVLILQWWTGTVLHSYLVLALFGRLTGKQVIIEFHEVIDTGEARMALARWYVGVVAPAVIGLATGFAVHSSHDAVLVRSRYRVGIRRPLAILPHGPHDHYRTTAGDAPLAALRSAPAGATNFLFFGIIRPYKGLEDLVAAFDAIPPDRIEDYWLTVVGETWEGWHLPGERIAASRYADRITFVNRYVHDAELDAHLRGADVVVLPYRRSSLSGPLHVAMGYGLPVVMTNVGGNAEAGEGYGGLFLVEPADVPALTAVMLGDAIRTVARYEHPRSWAETAIAYEQILDQLAGSAGPAGDEDRHAATARPGMAQPASEPDPPTGGSGR